MGSISDTIHCCEKDVSSAQITVLIIYGLFSPLQHSGYLTISQSFTNSKKGKALAGHGMKVRRRTRGTVPLVLISALGGDELSTSCPGDFTPEERTPSTH